MRTGVLFAPSRVAVQHTDIAQLTSAYATDVLRLCKSLQQLRKHAANALIRDLERSDTVFARAHHRQHNHSRGQDGWARARKSGQHGGSRALAYECMHADGALRCWRTVHDAAAHSACARARGRVTSSADIGAHSLTVEAVTARAQAPHTITRLYFFHSGPAPRAHRSSCSASRGRRREYSRAAALPCMPRGRRRQRDA